MNIEDSVAAVESILRYTFKNKCLLEEALTHPSYSDSPSYERLEFLGDAVLGLAISEFFYVNYPDLDPGDLTLLRAANISNEKLARVAVNHGLHKYFRHRAAALNNNVREFVIAVQEEDDVVVDGGHMKAPKVLADIVESVAGAVYIDCGSNLQMLWIIIRELLEPIVMLNVIEKQPQPITTSLYEACQKDQKDVNIRRWRKDGRFVASHQSPAHQSPAHQSGFLHQVTQVGAVVSSIIWVLVVSFSFVCLAVFVIVGGLLLANQ